MPASSVDVAPAYAPRLTGNSQGAGSGKNALSDNENGHPGAWWSLVLIPGFSLGTRASSGAIHAVLRWMALDESSTMGMKLGVANESTCRLLGGTLHCPLRVGKRLLTDGGGCGRPKTDEPFSPVRGSVAIDRRRPPPIRSFARGRDISSRGA